MAKILLLVFSCLLAAPRSGAQEASFRLVSNVKQYYCRGLPSWYLYDAYTLWVQGGKPLVYVFVSRADSVLEPAENGLYYTDTGLSRARQIARRCDSLGYHTFCYKTYFNSLALLSGHMLSYEPEAIIFGVMHELSHNYFRKDYISLPYRIEEAACDIIGNYGALEYARESGIIDTLAVIRQAEVTEALYRQFNIMIADINRNTAQAALYHQAGSKLLDSMRTSFNSFQKDCFSHPFNNAYLVKQENYCKYYFLLKEVYMKKRSYKAFIEVLRNVPVDEKDAEIYLQGLAKKN